MSGSASHDDRLEIANDSDAICEGCGRPVTPEAADDPRWFMEIIDVHARNNPEPCASAAVVRCPDCYEHGGEA
jgi:hypothetical protein